MATRSTKKATATTKAATRVAKFRFSSTLFEELGERLVSRPEIALAELIKNAYDADSADCIVSLGEDEISVQDHGHGMSEDDFLNNWMVVSSPAKGLQRYSRVYGRSMAGSKGVGRFSARFLGTLVTLESIAYDERRRRKTRLKAEFDWDKIARHDQVTSVDVHYRVTLLPDDAETGTKLRIGRLRQETGRIAWSKIKTDILRLTDPAAGLELPPQEWRRQQRRNGAPSDPGFRVRFVDDESDNDAGDDGDIATSVLGNFVGRVRLKVDEEGSMTYEVFWRGHRNPLVRRTVPLSRFTRQFRSAELRTPAGAPTDPRGLPVALSGTPHLPLGAAMNSTVFVDLRFFPKRKGTFAGLPVDGKRALGWVGEHSGFPIVDNGFTMESYADVTSDWLEIDASKAKNERSWQSVITPALYPMTDEDKKDPRRNPMLALPRGRQIIGRVHIATRKLPREKADESENWLQPNMDREALRSNDAFRLLWHVSRFAVELIAHFDREQRLKAEAKEETEKRAAAKDSLSAAIDEVAHSDDIDPVFREQIVSRLRTVEKSLTEAEEYSREARQSLDLMSLMGVMAGFMTHEFEKALDSLKTAGKVARKLGHENPALLADAENILKSEVALANYLDYMRVFIDRARNPRPQTFVARAQIALVVKTLSTIAQDHGIAVDINIEPRLPGPNVPIAAYNGIVVNLLSNALKSLVAKAAGATRKIRIYATNDNNYHVLVCADSGIGIPSYLRDRVWDPLYTTTADAEENPLGSGLGLGLSIVRRVVQQLKGKAELMDEAPPGYVTAFKIQLPINP